MLACRSWGDILQNVMRCADVVIGPDRAARLLILADDVRRALQLPAAARIVSITCPSALRGVVEILVEGAGWPVDEGAAVPAILPWIEEDPPAVVPSIAWEWG